MLDKLGDCTHNNRTRSALGDREQAFIDEMHDFYLPLFNKRLRDKYPRVIPLLEEIEQSLPRQEEEVRQREEMVA